MSKYSTYTQEQVDELLSNFLIDSWSYSKVASFSRNEKNFEREEIYMERGKSSATTVAGSAYHKALELYFNSFTAPVRPGVVELQTEAYNYIDEIPASSWRIQKTNPTVENCIASAVQTSNVLIENFLKEADSLTEDMDEILGVETKLDEWLTVNGVDIPLPCHAVLDLVVRLKNGHLVIIDHKSKKSFTDEKEIALVRGKQAIVYVLAWESAFRGQTVDEVWFVENKSSINKDGSSQLRKSRIQMDADTRTLYEAMLYEPLSRMLKATSDPDYIYTANDGDTLCDKAELYDFWTRTMIAEVDDFSDIPDNRKDQIRKRMRKIRDTSLGTISPKAIAEFRKHAEAFIPFDITTANMTKEEKIEHVLRAQNIIVRVEHTIKGYSSDTYLLSVAAGIKVGSVHRYSLDIANALGLPSVRINSKLAVYGDKSYIAVEAGHKCEKTLPWDASRLEGRRLPIGEDNFGNTIVWDLDNHSTPHVLVCGATGSGKSVCLKSTIEYAKLAGVEDIVILDPKYEFTEYGSFCEIEDIEQKMAGLVLDMQQRVRNGDRHLTLVVIDEFADAIASARSGRELCSTVRRSTDESPIVTVRERSLSENLQMLAQKGRSLGFRIVAATQRASVKIIDGNTKVNFPVQVCFRMPKAIDSKVVLDEEGAETLQGRGDGLMRSPEYLDVVRFQGFYKE